MLNLRVKIAYQQLPEETEISLFRISSTHFSSSMQTICAPHNEVHRNALFFVMGNVCVLYTDTQINQHRVTTLILLGSHLVWNLIHTDSTFLKQMKVGLSWRNVRKAIH
jgi:hypothetical protein